MSELRLQKYLSQCGVASRRMGEKLIQAGKVKVNGKVVTELGTKVDPVTDRIQVGSRFIRPPGRGIVLFHKPKGVVSTLSDPEGRPCVADYLTKKMMSYYPVGRLDFDSTGLIILTNDGEVAERLMHPRFGYKRTYRVRISGEISDKTMRRIERGVRLPDGMVTAEVKFIESGQDSTWLELTISEGRNRVIRRLMDHLRHPVIKLQRISHGPFKLQGLKAGELRWLTEREYELVRNKILEIEQGRRRR